MPSRLARSLFAGLLLTASTLAEPLRAQRSPNVEDPCYWQSARWAELTGTQQQLLGALGWTEEKWESGDPGYYPPSEFKTWAELNDEERLVNQALGLTEKTWDSPDCG